MKQCRTCGETKSLDRFSPHERCAQGVYPDCKDCRNAWARAKYARDPEAILVPQRAARARRPRGPAGTRKLNRYGLTDEEFVRMVDEQEGRCAICGAEPDVLVVDHCHETDVVRGLLCRWCNVGLGMFREDLSALERAHSYLERWRSGLTRQS
jgi:hypothetical protein